jgi:hypothetical protein
MSSEWEVTGTTTGGGKYEKPPAGNHLAVLVAVIDMGQQWQEPFKAGDKGYWSRRAYFVWELCDEKIAGTEKNHVIAIDLTMSRKDTSKLYLWYKARTGQEIPNPYDPTKDLGTHCMLNVVEKNGYPKVDGTTAVPKALASRLPAPTYPLTAVSLSQFQAKTPVPEWVPWCYGSPVEEHIKASKEIGGPKPSPKKKPPAEAAAADDDTGFDPTELEKRF